MAKRHKIRARSLRALLLDLLGGKCIVPGCIEADPEELTFDLKEAKGHKHHKGSTDQRMAFYWKEHFKGNVQVLCHKHNSEKGDQTNEAFLAQYAPNNEPF